MKKTLALLLCLAMLVTALSVNVFAETTPSVEVVTHESTASGDAIFAIKLSGFDSLKGLDLTVTGDDGVEFLSASALNTKSALAAGENYVIEDKHTLHIVELSDDLNGDIITVAAHVNVDGQSHEIKVAGELAKSGTELYDDVTFTPGKITPFVKSAEVEVEVETDQKVEVEQTAAGDGYFIPYGAVYNGDASAPEYLAKDENGVFADVTADTTIVKFPIPANGFGTYGIADSIVKENPAKQFGNYVADYKPETRTYGTLAIMGDWAAYRDYYLSKKAYTDAQLVEMLYARYKEKKDAGYNYNYVAFGANGNKYVIQVTAVEQNNYLWKTADKLEYGVRFLNVLSEREYATVAYYTEGDAITFAKEIRAE